MAAQLFFLGLSLAMAWIVIRSVVKPTAAASDVRLFKERYERRGLTVGSVRRLGTDWFTPISLRGRGPIRKYEILTEDADGRRETRVRGLSRGNFKPTVWRYDPGGRCSVLE